MPEFCKRLRLNLAYALTRDAKLAANFLKRARMSIFKTKTELDHFALAISKPVEHLIELLAKHGITRSIGRSNGCGVFDKVAQG